MIFATRIRPHGNGTQQVGPIGPGRAFPPGGETMTDGEPQEIRNLDRYGGCAPFPAPETLALFENGS
jgi:hypothetical protein